MDLCMHGMRDVAYDHALFVHCYDAAMSPPVLGSPRQGLAGLETGHDIVGQCRAADHAQRLDGGERVGIFVDRHDRISDRKQTPIISTHQMGQVKKGY